MTPKPTPARTTKRAAGQMTSPKGGVGELRQDIITGKWVVIATGRSKRPDQFASERGRPSSLPKYKESCPFCNLGKFPQSPDTLRLPDDPDNWQVHIFGNKYPAFRPKDEFHSWQVGPYRAIEAVGYHEVLATRWHNHIDALLSLSQMSLQLEALIMRFRQLRTKPSVNYIQIIKNHGEEAGGSLEHPHHQIFTVPVLPSDVHDLLQGAEAYAQQHGAQVFQTIIDAEKQVGQRLVWENEEFIAFCPYASRLPFETWIVPRRDAPYFDTTGPAQRQALAEALLQVLGRMYTGLNNPPYNYYIHSAPCDDTGFVCNLESFQHFRWHIQILPRLSKFGGFELGTGLEINTTAPEEAARFLREQKLPEQSRN